MKEKMNCPLCSGEMTVEKTASGCLVSCRNVCDPLCHETVYGHGKNEREAFEIACQKFKKN